MEKLTPDICVIGGGAAGLSVAAATAVFGVSTVLIERRRMGGECLNTGCIPSKALLAAAKRAHDMRAGGAFGVQAAEGRGDFGKVRAHLRSVVVGDEFEICARRTVIATGSLPALPAIPGLHDGVYFTSETIFDLDVLPSHLVVIGAGATGLELAQAFRRLGSDVTVLDAGAALAQDDPECVNILLAQLEKEGIVIHTGVTVTRISRAIGQIGVTITHDGKEELVGGSHLLVAG